MRAQAWSLIVAAVSGACSLAGITHQAGVARPQAGAPETVGRGCPPERSRDGEVRLAFLGDSGYGTGISEWGTHGQEGVAERLNRLELRPDLVLFLGDNIYWLGNAQLYKSRFDDMYDPLIRECRAHVALGNHDVKGCRAVTEYEQWESCFQELRTAIVADKKVRLLRQGVPEAEAIDRAEREAQEDMEKALEAEALPLSKANCLPGDASAYEDDAGATCHAGDALAHAQFGFGSVEKGDPPKSARQRYYSILFPLPKKPEPGAPAKPPAPEERPLVDVIVLDTNTLQVEGGVLGRSDKPREDRLQLQWLRSAMAQWLPTPGGDDERVWKILAMHHPPKTPRGCACLFFGKCLGGHSDEEALARQLDTALEGLERPDLVMAAHNHLYARSHPLGADGRPVREGSGAVRYFVTGGGGAPLYGIKGPDDRWAKSDSLYHFVYMRLTSSSAFFWTIDESGTVHDSGCFEKGSNVDLPLASDFRYDDALPPRCALDGGQPVSSPKIEPEPPSPSPPSGQAAGAPERSERQ
ncbi:MAG TPA: metallophosphoesterase [Vicinamibacteria bacterium]|nr:metallophosphoesterase [Vicinamibacteria bacterium]